MPTGVYKHKLLSEETKNKMKGRRKTMEGGNNPRWTGEQRQGYRTDNGSRSAGRDKSAG